MKSFPEEPRPLANSSKTRIKYPDMLNIENIQPGMMIQRHWRKNNDIVRVTELKWENDFHLFGVPRIYWEQENGFPGSWYATDCGLFPYLNNDGTIASWNTSYLTEVKTDWKEQEESMELINYKVQLKSSNGWIEDRTFFFKSDAERYIKDNRSNVSTRIVKVIEETIQEFDADIERFKINQFKINYITETAESLRKNIEEITSPWTKSQARAIIRDIIK